MRRRTQSEYIHDLSQAKPSIKCYGVYIGNKIPIEHKCRTCKFKFKASPDNVLHKQGCPSCSRTNCVNPQRKTHAEYVQALKVIDPSITCLGIYTQCFTHMLHRHSCGHEWEVTPANTLKGRGCPKCKLSMRSVKLGKRTVYVRGYEDKALTWITQHTRIKAKHINVHNEKTVPNFAYTYRGSNRMYWPDFFIPHLNLIVEVKSLATLGVKGNFYQKEPAELFYTTRAKARKVRADGYEFKLLIIAQSGERIKPPDDWINMSHTQFKKQLAASK